MQQVADGGCNDAFILREEYLCIMFTLFLLVLWW